MTTKISRAKITWGGRKGTVTVHFICEKTKQVVPVYGLELHGARALVQLLIDLGKNGMELPKEYEDETL